MGFKVFFMSEAEVRMAFVVVQALTGVHDMTDDPSLLGDVIRI